MEAAPRQLDTEIPDSCGHTIHTFAYHITIITTLPSLPSSPHCRHNHHHYHHHTQGHHHHHRHHSIAIFGTYLCAAYTNNVSSFTGTVKRHIFSQRKVQLWGAMIHTYMYKLYSYYIHCENATLANLQRRRLEEYIIIIRWQNFCSRGLWTLGLFVFTTWVSLKILWTWNTSYDCNGLTICFHCGTTRAASYMQRSKVECMLHVSECITGH